MQELKLCPWCWNKNKNKPMKPFQLEWTVIDDDFGQPVRSTMIHYCFSCGRKLDEEADNGGSD